MCNERDVLKENYQELQGEYDDIVRRETYLQGINRQLRNKLVTAESQLVEVTGNCIESQPASSQSSSSEESPSTPHHSRKETLLYQENQDLLDLLHILSGMTSIPYSGVGNVEIVGGYEI